LGIRERQAFGSRGSHDAAADEGGFGDCTFDPEKRFLVRGFSVLGYASVFFSWCVRRK
jgi:hypothetical protein